MDINVLLGLTLSGLLLVMALIVLAITMIRYAEKAKDAGRRRREMLKARLQAKGVSELELRRYD